MHTCSYPSRIVAGTVILLCFLAVVGCSTEPPRYKTHGRVVYKGTGKPFTSGGNITFESRKPPYIRAVATLDEKGEFDLSTWRDREGAVEGEQRVIIGAGETAGTSALQGWLKKIDVKYMDYPTTPLRYTIQPNQENDITVEITMPGQK
jgi:hypothetical protein